MEAKAGTKTNLLGKLAAARVAFQNANLKKSGLNKFAGYDYYELCDILPKINALAAEMRFFCAVSFGKETAELTVTDIDDPSQSLVFSSPMAAVSLKGMHEVQNMGAAQTYMRRYLYMAAFEITECDGVDGSAEPEQKPPPKQQARQETPPPAPQKPKDPVKDKIGVEIGAVLKAENPQGFTWFSDGEIECERGLYAANGSEKAAKQLERLDLELKRRKEAFNKANPADGIFKDDVPGGMDDKPGAAAPAEELDIF